MIYRPEIDGLRAIAVLPVILFHAGFNTFSGGFVGVDVFFVISGYLITSIILSDLEEKSFSILDFYERRARRILPALFFVMFCTIPFAWMFLSSSAFLDFSQSLTAVSIFSSNFLFYIESGYFDAAAELKPLLHTWSLAVEEQFYLFFPIFLIFCFFIGIKKYLIFLIIILICSASFFLAVHFSTTNPAAGFYLIHTRGWEILFGSLTAIYLTNQNNPIINLNKTFKELLGTIGLLLILYSIFKYDKSTPFPGYYALVPTIGTVMCIFFANQKTYIGRFLGNKIFLSIGLISYSAYLWHQPLIAISKRSELYHSSNLFIVSIVLISLALAWFSWRFIEAPFRSKPMAKGYLDRAQIFKFAFAGTMLFSFIGIYGHYSKGFPIPQSKQPIVKLNKTDKDFIVIGDSHGEHLIPGLESLTTGNITNYTYSGCIPFRNVDRYDFRSTRGVCANKINSWLDQIINDDQDKILLISSMGPVYLDGVTFKGKDPDRVKGLGVELINDRTVTDRYKVYEIGLRQTLEEFLILKNTKIIFTMDVPELGIDSGCTRRAKQIKIGKLVLGDFVSSVEAKSCLVDKKEYNSRVDLYKKLVTNILDDFPNVYLYDPSIDFCNDNHCKGFDSRYGYLYKDSDHLSESGGSVFYAENLYNNLLKDL